MKNQKGFTLIELVVAIGLLGLFAITIGITLNRTFKSQKDREEKEYNEKIKSSANLYVTNKGEIINKLSNEKGFVLISVKDLIEDGYLSENTIDPETNSPIDKELKIKVSYDANGTIKIDYPYSKQEDYLQALDIYVNLGDNTIEDYCYNGLGTSSLSYVNAETGSYDHNYIKEKEQNEYKNINCVPVSVNTSSVGTYRLVYNYKLKNTGTWKRATRRVIVVDNVPPTCVIEGNREVNAPWRYEGLSDFKVGCSDAGGCLTVKQPTSPLINMATKPVVITDNAGNQTVCTLNVYSDQEGPSCLQIDAPTTWTKEDRTVKANCTDKLSGCEQDIVEKTYSTDRSTALFYIYDKVGNKNACSVQVYVDKTAPTTTLSTSTLNSTTSIVLTGTALDTYSGLVAYQFSTKTDIIESSTGWTRIDNTKKSTTVTKTVTDKGTSSWYLYTLDEAGNVGKSSVQTITIEAEAPDAPTINISNPYQVRSGGSVNATVTWKSGQDVNSYCIQSSNKSVPSLSDSCWSNVSSSQTSATKGITLTGNVGNYYYVAYVKNSYGKISNVSNVSYGEIIDTTPTAPSFRVNPYQTTSGGKVTGNVTWNSGQNITHYCILRQTAPAPTSLSSCWVSVSSSVTTAQELITVTGSPGKYYFVSYVKNKYNEISPVSNADYGEIKATAPSAPTLSANTYSTTTGNSVTLTAKWTSGQNVSAYCIQRNTDAVPSTSSSCWVSTSTSSSSGTKQISYSTAGTYGYRAYVKNTSNLISPQSTSINIIVTQATVNNYGDTHYCWYVYNSSSGIKINTREDAGNSASNLFCRSYPNQPVQWEMPKYSILTHSGYWGETVFTANEGTHTYGWYNVKSFTNPSGTYQSTNCYAAFYYTAKGCSECISNSQCTTTRNIP